MSSFAIFYLLVIGVTLFNLTRSHETRTASPEHWNDGERGRNQQAHFLYQTHFSCYMNIWDENYAIKQELKFQDMSFRIHNKDKILDGLDRIGINSKTIWCDFDHTAAYIKNKYLSNPPKR